MKKGKRYLRVPTKELNELRKAFPNLSDGEILRRATEHFLKKA